MNLSGKSLIGSHAAAPGKDFFRAFSPVSGEAIAPEFYSASALDVDHAANLAADAAPIYGRIAGREKAAFLDTIATKIETVAELLVARAHQETALPVPRLKGEVGRTCGQLRLFAKLVEEGSWTMPRIDRPDPARKPAAKPDVRSMLIPIGPVAVFGASNFPLAFSVAGGDTASALAAGNPVIVKAHPAHPGTSELVGLAIRQSVLECGLPEGVFSLLFDSGTSVGVRLVQHRLVKAAAFTGSEAAGRALFDLAVNRPEPIPFYGEMASTNPLFILPGAMTARAENIAADLYSSFTLGAGQFCTKPGLVFVSESASTQAFLAALREKVATSSPCTLLTPGIAASYARELARRQHEGRWNPGNQGKASDANARTSAAVALFEIDISSFAANPGLAEEHFGPSTLVIRYSEKQQMLDCARSFKGHLTATVHGTPADLEEYSDLIRILERKVGRMVFNGFPTGVEVCHAMIHGGPYPASTDPCTTSVGSLAIFRFARPVCYQDFPNAALPAELQNENPLGVWRIVDGECTKEPAC
jgi:alpha-ketoglutaric semialdehyde dehydrogenase